MKHAYLYALLLLLVLGSCRSAYRIVIPPGELPLFFDYSREVLPLVSAHRGGRFRDGYPENSLATFKDVLQHNPALIECDVNISRDSVLLLLHDNTLERTTTGRGAVNARDWKSLKKLRLLDDRRAETRHRIPKLKKVLKWARKRTILTVDVKDRVPLEKVVALIERTKAEEYAVLIVHALEEALLVHRLNPRLMISAGITSQEDLNAYLQAGIPAQNLLAFTGTRRIKPRLYQRLRELGIPVLFGTFDTADTVRKEAARDQLYRTYLEQGIHILATDRPLDAGELLLPRQREVEAKRKYLRWPGRSD